MALFENRNWFWVLGCPILFAAVALKKKSVDRSGAVAGLIVALSCSLAGLEFILGLLFFFVTSTVLTRMGSKRKKKVNVEGFSLTHRCLHRVCIRRLTGEISPYPFTLRPTQVDGEYKEGGQRNYVQVFSNGFAGTIACVALICYDLNTEDQVYTFFAAMFLGHYSCCIGDTWASEAGTASQSRLAQPILITSLKPVKPGTNGGISVIGTTASALGGLALGLVFWLSGSPLGLLPCAFIGLSGGFGGSFVDSVLGATLQFSGYVEGTEKVVNEPGKGVVTICGNDILDNHQVNLVSSTATALACGVAASSLLH
mmetsp:Transcript_45266/g.70970  ORF Transcript_45266/g.70970 Transcript_45266/m.70970 type:complete len:313 (+) Transcript_45266:130-1068(+)|eukprot:CAMPEP_0184294426 /NCGR_PEP_ID=MMETSP1049-20130417/5625_1 /TAXON_ID=77928 /ORGANISM="Proteomonas sulcata, Strain CCMP704" /LENGTH=312 /DNA_ID=CAMNT_0026602709 /DNA_START=104 /DNA_END=1042 /DNA_ORIENTATION=-